MVGRNHKDLTQREKDELEAYRCERDYRFAGDTEVDSDEDVNKDVPREVKKQKKNKKTKKDRKDGKKEKKEKKAKKEKKERDANEQGKGEDQEKKQKGDERKDGKGEDQDQKDPKDDEQRDGKGKEDDKEKSEEQERKDEEKNAVPGTPQKRRSHKLAAMEEARSSAKKRQRSEEIPVCSLGFTKLRSLRTKALSHPAWQSWMENLEAEEEVKILEILDVESSWKSWMCSRSAFPRSVPWTSRL